MSTRNPNGGQLADQSRALARVAPPLEKVLAATDLIEQVVGIVQVCAECAREIAEQRTEQARISSETQVQIEFIRSRREILTQLLDQIFAERKENFRMLFDRFDTAAARGDLDASQQVLDTIVNLAKSSPFQALRDAASAHEALLDKNTVWEF